MRLRHPYPRTLTVLAAAALAAATWAAAAPTASAASRSAKTGYLTVPTQVYAPYVETYLNKYSLSGLAERSGARYLTLAFLQTAAKGSCTATWNGDASQPISGGHYLAEIKALRAAGGDVIPSFGGAGADTTGTEIADSCKNVNKIAAVYESLVSKYHVTRLDMDVEGHSLNNLGGISRRNEAIAMAQKWAAARGVDLQVDFTIPVEPYGLDPNGVHVLASAIADGVKIDVVNIMVFDYYLAHEGVVDMPAAAESAALNLHNQLSGLFPGDSAHQLWQLEGMTLLPGVDDRGKNETTYLPGAAKIMAFAEQQHMSLLSIWALQRDNGGCPGRIDSNTCSGVPQPRWAFSHLLESFTH